MTKPRLLAAAEREMHEAAAFYNAAVAGLGSEFITEVEQAIRRIRENPILGRSESRLIRRVVLRRFPYSIVYALANDHLVIVAVAHHRREPRYWKSRID